MDKVKIRTDKGDIKEIFLHQHLGNKKRFAKVGRALPYEVIEEKRRPQGKTETKQESKKSEKPKTDYKVKPKEDKKDDGSRTSTRVTD